MAFTVDIVQSQFRQLQEYADRAFALSSTYISTLQGYIIADLDMTPPTIDITDRNPFGVDSGLDTARPDEQTYPPTPADPISTDHPFPSSPSFMMPTAPTLTDISIPSFVSESIVGITTQLPTVNFDVPNVGQIDSGSEYSGGVLSDVIEAKLTSNITSGGTMIDPTVEADIWDRDLERHEQQLQDSVDKLTSQWAKLGFSVPDGLLAGSILGINNEYLNKRLDRSREIAVKQAELEQQGMFKSLELGIGLEKLFRDTFSDYARRVFETSKTAVDVLIEIYKQRVNQYNVNLEVFKADMIAYKTRVEAESLRVEVYKSQIAALQLVAGIDDLRVKSYVAQISGIEHQAKIYQTDVQTVAIMYDAEKQKIEKFKAQVEAYAAEVDSLTKQYTANIEGYKAYIQAYVASSDSQTKLSDVETRAQIARSEATVKEWEVQLKIIQENTAMRLEALKSVAQTTSNLAAGAMSAGHVSASQAASYSDSDSEIHQYLE